jgi:hypothetical protein
MRHEPGGPTVPAATNIASLSPFDLAGSEAGVEILANVHPLVGARGHVAGASDRDHLLERLHHLRTILPVFAEELASSRRQAAALRVENRGLIDEVRRLRRKRGESAYPSS